MTAALGEFEGRSVAAISLVLTNTGDGLSKAVAVAPVQLHLGEEVFLLVKTTVHKVRHDPMTDNPDLLTRVNILRSEVITVVDHLFAAQRIEAQEAANDAKAGRTKIPFGEPVVKGDVVHTDDSGVVLTAAEVAERQGREIPDAPVVVVYTDGQRFLWPDEYADGVSRPCAGQELAPGFDEVTVAYLLDSVTGASFDEDIVDAEIVEEDEPVDDLDDWEDPEPVRDLDPAAVAYVDCTISELKARLGGQLSQQLLRQALDAEQAGKNRDGAVEAIMAQLIDLSAS